MRDLRLPAALSGLVAACGLAIIPVAKAAAPNADVVGGGSCQLSIPTTDTKFRPKATGARNESTTTSSFVICTLPHAKTAGAYKQIEIIFYSLDGVSRILSCTAVPGVLDSPDDPIRYSTKTGNAFDTNAFHEYFMWSAADFGGTYGDPIPGGFNNSVTCNLPPQTAINIIEGWD